MKGFKTLMNVMSTLLITCICWIPFYVTGEKTILTAGLTMLVGFLLSSIVQNYILSKFDTALEEFKNKAYWFGVLESTNIVERGNPRWSRKDTPIYDDEGKEIGTSTNYGEMSSEVRRAFKDRA